MPAKGNVSHDDHRATNNPPPATTTDQSQQPPSLGAGAAAAAAPPPCIKDVDHLVQEIKENLKLGHHIGHVHRHYQGSGFGPLKSVAGGNGAVGRMRGAARGHRSSPYAVPPSSRVGPSDPSDNSAAAGAGGGSDGGPSQLRRWNHRRRYPSTCKADAELDAVSADPFEMLQELITDGSLIKEAVRRLQLGLTPKYGSPPAAAKLAADEDGESYYDSDDGCRTPPAYPDLCCEVGGI